MKKFVGLISVVTILAACITFAYAENSVTGKYWMSAVPDNTSIADISIPGTHDSAANNIALSFKTKCQNTTTSQQLDMGIRYLDIRLCYDDEVGGKLRLVHNIMNCKNEQNEPLTYKEVVNGAYKFLKENPSETLLFCIKEDHGNNRQAVADEVFDYFKTDSNMWFTQNRVPTLGEVRGKIIFLNRLGCEFKGATDGLCGINIASWPEQRERIYDPISTPSKDTQGNTLFSVTIQDRYMLSDKKKWIAVKNMLDAEKEQGVLTLNYLSTASNIGPKVNANYINNMFLKTELDKNKCYGTVIFDFADSKLAQAIYSCNKGVFVKTKPDSHFDKYHITTVPVFIIIGAVALALVAAITSCIVLKVKKEKKD